MQCPIDGSDLLITERQGIEIDYCPRCRGVWLDRGELDKLIERAAQPYAAPTEIAPQINPASPDQPVPLAPPRQADDARRYRDDRRRDNDDDDNFDTYRDRDRERRPRRRRSFLDDLFDFDFD